MDNGDKQNKQRALLVYLCRSSGGVIAFAKMIGATAAQVYNWRRRTDRIPYRFALSIADKFKNAAFLDVFYPELKELNQKATLAQQKNDLSQLPIDMINLIPPTIALQNEVKASQKLHNDTMQTVIVDTKYNLLVGFGYIMACQKKEDNDHSCNDC